MTWTVETLETLTSQQEGWIVEVQQSCLQLSNDSGIAIFLYPGEQQMLAESILFPSRCVTDHAALNELILRTHQLVPLSAIALKQIGNESFYTAFGALSSDSKASVVIEEIETLFINVEEFLELYSEYLGEEA